MLASCKNSEEKAKKAMVDAGRAEQDHAAAQEKAARTTEVSLAEMQNKAEQASFAMARGAAQIPAKLEDRAHNIEMELNRTIQHTDEVHKTITKGERRVKELLFQQEENKKNQDRITDLVLFILFLLEEKLLDTSFTLGNSFVHFISLLNGTVKLQLNFMYTGFKLSRDLSSSTGHSK